jgi:hypothetical protein
VNVELARALYFRELDMRAQQDARVGTYAAVLSAVGAALAYLVSNSWPASSSLCRAALVLSALSVVSFVIAVAYVLMASVGFDYDMLPRANNVLGYWREISKYYEENPEAPGTAAADFDDFLLRHLASAATKNAETAQVRAARFHHAGMCLIAVIVLAALSAITLAADRALQPAQKNRSIAMSDPSKTPPPPQPPAAQPAPPAPAPPAASFPPKPPEPQNIIVKGGAEKAFTPLVKGVGGPKKP